MIISLFEIPTSQLTDTNKPIAETRTHVSQIIKIVTHVKRASALKYVSKSNSVTKYNYISAYKS